jgi:hypothetical protein
MTVTNTPPANAYAHDAEVDGSVRAASRIVPVVCEVIGRPASVVDLGGGTGAWCAAFKSHGVPHVRCIDHPSASTGGLLIEAAEFQPADLSCDRIPPVPADLAVSVEVAEHLPDARADWIVEFLTASAPIVLFSAAVPRQDGVHHVNEQFRWYWTRRFAARGFEERDCLRGRLLFDASIPYWYRQNLTLYVDPRRVPPFAVPAFLPPDFTLLHESIAARLREPPTLRTMLREFGPALFRAVRHRWSR